MTAQHAKKMNRHDQDGSPWKTAAFLLGLVAVFYWASLVALQQSRLQSWPQAAATIMDFDAGDRHPGWTGNWYANPAIRFSYTVDGTRYQSIRMNPSPLNYQNKQLFKADTKGFSAGAIVTCWYNSGDPTVAYVVNCGITQDIWVIMSVTSVLILFVGYRVVKLFRTPVTSDSALSPT